jgi:hypothetical protein
MIPFTLMMEAIRSAETSVLARPTRRHIPEDGFHQLKIHLKNSLFEHETRILSMIQSQLLLSV